MSQHLGQALEELAKIYGWDDKLIQLMHALPRAVADRYIEQAWSYDKDGWRHMLPTLAASARVLCLEARFGNTAAAFAEAGIAVTVIHPCPTMVRIIRHRLAAINLADTEVLHVPSEPARLPFPDGHFDAFIFHDVIGGLLADPATAASPFASLTPTLANEAFRVLKPGGFACFGIKNPHGYALLLNRLRHPLSSKSGTAGLIPMRRAGGMLRRAGFQGLCSHPFLVERERVTEVIPPCGYRSARNSFTAGERLKQVVLGKTGSRYLAPAYGLVCGKGCAPASQIRKFTDDLAARGILSGSAAGGPVFRRYLTLPGKAIITLGEAADGRGNVLIIIPKVPRVREWRRKEIGIVNELRAYSPFLADRLPRLYTECAVGDETCFAISEIPGMTIDRRVRHLDRLTRSAVDFLIRFNRITAYETTVNDAAFENLFGAIVGQVSATYPDTRPVMERIEARLRRAVHGRNIVGVWLHGDYKLENLIFDKKTLEINGIIDWEHSRRSGLPWLDLMYLLAYNRMVSEHRSFFEIYRDVILPENHTAREKSAIAAYAAAMPVTPGMRSVLACIFFMHHIGFRYIYVLSRKENRRNIFAALEDIEERLARPA